MILNLFRSSSILGVLATSLALFFVVLAVFDGFEQEQEIEYVGEFLNESDFNYVDFPTSISRSVNSQSFKIQRLVVLSLFDFVSAAFGCTKEALIIPTFIPLDIFSRLNFLIGKSIAANAP